jgi:hypothetical protein
LRRHGDIFQRFRGGFYRARGRADDTMNLGGIKVLLFNSISLQGTRCSNLRAEDSIQCASSFFNLYKHEVLSAHRCTVTHNNG